jgi:hypothetical protein
MLSLKPHQDISAEQCTVLEAQLAAVSTKIRQQLRIYTDRFFSERHEKNIMPTLINRLGELEVELTSAYQFYDVFMDILTQRLSDEIGPLLRGCDAIAAHGLHRGFLSDISVSPLVYCDRGFGASTLREGVHIAGLAPNPIPFIGIPYSRMNEKYNLISISHEVGHQALAKLNLVTLWQQVFYEALNRVNAPPLICHLYANWSKEIVPDFWAFCLSGMGQTSSLRDVLILPAPLMFTISTTQPHPPAFLRFLISLDWCRQLWGKGDWDDWETEWRDLYPLNQQDETTQLIISEAQQYIPVISKAILTTKFRKLEGKPLTSLFALETLRPEIIQQWANLESLQTAAFKNAPIGVQLAVFRWMREKRVAKQSVIDQYMDVWLKSLK